MKTEILLFSMAMAVRLCVPPAAAFVTDSVPPHPAFTWRWHQRDLLGYYSARLIYR